MNRISIINEIEENYDVNSVVSNQVPIWQYIRNLIYGQPNYSKNLSKQIKDFYCLVQNHSWGNYQSCKKFKYLLFTDSNEEIIHNNRKIDKTSQNIIELIGNDLMVVVNPNGKIHNKSIECSNYYMSSSFFHYKRWRNGLTDTTLTESTSFSVRAIILFVLGAHCTLQIPSDTSVIIADFLLLRVIVCKFGVEPLCEV